MGVTTSSSFSLISVEKNRLLRHLLKVKFGIKWLDNFEVCVLKPRLNEVYHKIIAFIRCKKSPLNLLCGPSMFREANSFPRAIEASSNISCPWRNIRAYL